MEEYTDWMNLAGIVSWRSTGLPSLSRDVISLVERLECISVKGDEVIAQPAALCEVVPELFLFCLVKAFQVKLHLHYNRTHRSMTDAGFFAVLLDDTILPDACLFIHNLLYYIGLIPAIYHVHQAIHLHPLSISEGWGSSRRKSMIFLFAAAFSIDTP